MSMFRNLITISGGGSILPPAYQQVEYIESQGAQYIDTNYIGGSNSDFEITMARLSTFKGYQQYFAGKNSSPCFPKVFADGNHVERTVVQSNSSQHIRDFAANNIYKIKVEGSNIYVNDSFYNTFTRSIGTDTVTHWIFNAHEEPTLFAYMKLYRLKISESGVLVRDFIPCYRKSDNEIGLYDIINGVFYTNDGTGTFIKGNNI